MKTVAVLSQKGGAGKTTLCVHLAVAAERAGKSTAIIDLDPQASATGWKDLRKDLLHEEAPAVVSAQPARLSQVLKTAADAGAALSVIDTAPHSESASLAAARAADIVLIPCRPAILDLKAISLSVDVAKLAKKTPVVVLNAVPPRGTLAEDAIAAIRGSDYADDVAVAPVSICYRAAYMHALAAGQVAQEYEEEGKAASEITELFAWLRTQIKL